MRISWAEVRLTSGVALALLVSGLAPDVAQAQVDVYLDFRNHIWGVIDAPVYDFDGQTPLVGANFLATLHFSLTPEGATFSSGSSRFREFGESDGPGYWVPKMVRVPLATPGQGIWVQVRVSEMIPALPPPRSAPRGGSKVFKVVAGELPAVLVGLESFSIQPEELSVARQADQIVIRWVHGGASRYRLETSTSLDLAANWQRLFEENGLERFGETLSVTNLISKSSGFYRLLRWR